MSYQLLNNLRVIESSAFIAAPLAGLLLSQFGADVIRIDMIGGGIDYGRMPTMPSDKCNGRSLYWTSLNKGKRSIAIDLRKPEGKEIIQALITAPSSDAGVLLTNIGTPWLAHSILSEKRPDVITCTIEGNGDGSTAVDYTVNCATGYPYMTGSAGAQHPINHVLPAWDVACAHHAALSVVAAVNHRIRSKEGSEIRLALSDIAFTTLSHLGILAETELLGQEREAIGNYLYGAFGRDFVTKDSARMMVVAISPNQWRALINACDIEDSIRQIEHNTGLNLAKEEGRFQAREHIASLLESWFACRPKNEIVAQFQKHKVTFGNYQSVSEMLENDPRVSLSNPVFETINTPGIGEHISAGPSVRIPGATRRETRPAQLLGNDTDCILEEVLGMSLGEIGKLHDAGIVAGPKLDPTLA